MNDLRPTPTSSHGNKQIFTFRNLETCSHVFLRHDAVKPPLQPAYDGPYKVLRRDHRTFRLLLNGRPTSVSTDRLKPAYVANEDPPQPTITPPNTATNTATNTTDTNTKQTRSGRNIQRPYEYTNPELTDMVLIYGEALSNAGAARRLYMERFPGRQVPCELLSTEIEAVQDLGVSWTWSLKICKLLKKNRMLVADDLHYEWVFPVSQFGERCTNKDYILIIFNVSNT
ncbi:hypothetical protein GEV33_001548 [Tenebrio molitor]|uniref:DUF4817 domain-containing protein n=1 Tax=Tenebrio molitor TaxID=7067 RepID=A0A8J6LJG3_TENMO|nr:hypothetical protein GEV33_001548 [Tenebrio molitor]